MIVDLHTQVWSSVDQLGRDAAERIRRRQTERWAEFDGSTESHERAMTCVDSALVFGYRSDRLGAHVPNEFIADFVAREPQRRAGVAGIDPMGADAMDQFQAALDMGFVGITISPTSQGFHPAHSDAMALYEQCVAAGMPLFVVQGDPLVAAAMLEFSRPMLWDEVARTFPSLQIVINQLGYPWIDETLILLDKHANLYADISGVASRPWQLYNALLNALSLRVIDKLLFSSGFPRELPAKTIETLYSVNAYSHGTHLPSVPRTFIRNIIERNIADCLGIELDVAARGQQRNRTFDSRPESASPSNSA